MRFKVKARRGKVGITHNRKQYYAGDIIESNADLATGFSDRFVRVGDVPSPEEIEENADAIEPGQERTDGRKCGRKGKLQVVEGEATPPPEEPDLTNVSSELQMVPKGGGWFDVINKASKKTINTKPLRKEAALALVND
jgi:hypothetical protein